MNKLNSKCRYHISPKALAATGGYQWEERLFNGAILVTVGRLFYTQDDGTVGTLNFVTSP
jgi:hypothetical protein